MQGWYYLHTNGDLIYKPETGSTHADIRESDFAVAMWPMDAGDRETAWQFLVEAKAAGVSADRISELASKWGCNDDDAKVYAERVGVVLQMDGNQWCATRKDFKDLMESKAGFGDTCLDAMAALAKDLGYRPTKMWGATFHDLLK